MFEEVRLEVIQDLGVHYSSQSGSRYYFLEEGVYRISNHWGRVGNCRWKLVSSAMQLTADSVEKKSKPGQFKVGYAKWTDFYPNNEQENLFYIAIDFATKTVDFHHKLNPSFDGQSVCRNASETAKRIKICKEVLLEDKWANYLNFNSIDSIREEIINELLTTNNSFIEIKKKYLR